jgi:magnesium transporter
MSAPPDHPPETGPAAAAAPALPENGEAEESRPYQHILDRLEEGAPRSELSRALDALHAADIADLLETLPEEQWDAIVGILDLEETADVLHEVRDEQKEEILEDLPLERLTAIVGEMEPDEAAEALDLLDGERVRAVLHRLPREHAAHIRALIGFEPETAGRIMTPDYFAVGRGLTVDEMLAQAREEAEDAESLHRVLVVDEAGRLVGTLRMQDALGEDPATPVAKLMDRAVLCIHAERDQEVAAHMMMKYDLGLLPVVGDGGRLLGIITFDDVMDILEDEAEEDMYRLAGIGADDPLAEGVVKRAYKRLPWLTTTLVGGLGLAVIIANFQPTLRQIVALVSFIPVIAGLSGNVGIQSSTVTVRGLATGEVHVDDLFRLLRRELAVGLLIGVVCAVVVAGGAHLFLDLAPEKAAGIESLLSFTLILGLAAFAGILVAALIGTVAPLACHRLGVDPAVAAGPFVTVAIDITTQSIYLGVATAFLL